MENSYSESANKVLQIAREQAQAFNHRLIGTEHVLLALVIESTGDAGKLLRSQGVTPTLVREEIERYTGYGSSTQSDYMEFSPRLQLVLSYARRQANTFGSDEITTNDLLLGLLANGQVLAAMILHNLGLDVQSIVNQASHPGASGVSNEPAGPTNQGQSKMPELDKVAVNLNQRVLAGGIDPLLNREKEVARVIQILSRRTKNNPVLVGEPGVGKTAIAQGIAAAIVHGKVPEGLKNKRLMALDMANLVAGTKYRGEFENRMKKILTEIRDDGNVILFVDEMHTLIGAGGAEGAIDASNILKPQLARGDLQMIGATTFDEYQKYIEKDQALARRFQQVRISEPSPAATLNILHGLRPKYEAFHHVKISDEALEQAVQLSTRYIANRFLPDKAVDLVDEAAAAVKIKHGFQKTPQLKDLDQQIADLDAQKERAVDQQDFSRAADLLQAEEELRAQRDDLTSKLVRQDKKGAVVTAADIAKVVSQWTGVPVTKMTTSDTKRLANLEQVLHERVIGQDAAIKAVSRAIRRSRAGIKDENRPIGSFLFLGPTGVGKTELAKALAEAVFGSEKNMIRVDMSEYMDSVATSKMIGSAPGYVGYEEGGQLSERVRRNPYSVVLLDEVEKANPDVFNLLLQVLDDGFLTDSKGRKVDFRNTIIIMTSNLGSRSLQSQQTVGFAADSADQDQLRAEKVRDATRAFFRPEFLNRIDETITFKSLTKSELRQIVNLMTKRLVDRLGQQEIQLSISRAAEDVIAKDGYDPENGARPLRRAIQRDLEDPIASALVSGEAKAGQKIKVGSHRGQLKFDWGAPEKVKAWHILAFDFAN